MKTSILLRSDVIRPRNKEVIGDYRAIKVGRFQVPKHLADNLNVPYSPL